MTEDFVMRKWVKWAVMLVLLTVFVFSGVSLLAIQKRYKDIDERNEAAVDMFVAAAEDETGENSEGGSDDAELAPIVVDFDGLKEVNSDVVGWIYGGDTQISYPVVQGEDNDFYLHHSYDMEESNAGSIFVEASNSPGFVDGNTIIYGHHMKNQSMFASLDYWADQEYYDAHPVLWLLTPEQDYKIVLFSGYTTPGRSDTYTTFPADDPLLEAYIAASQGKSDFQSDVTPGGEGRYVLLSTCAYNFEEARYVLHGVLEPVESAGGVRIQ